MDHLILIIMLVFFLAVFIDVAKTAIGIIREDIPFLFKPTQKKVKNILNKQPVKQIIDEVVKPVIHDHPKAGRLVQGSVISRGDYGGAFGDEEKVVTYQYVYDYFDNGKSYRDGKSQSYMSTQIWGFVKAHVLIFGCPNIGDRLTIDKDAPSITKQCYPRNTGTIAGASGVTAKIIHIRNLRKSDKEQKEWEDLEVLSFVPMYLQILDYNKSWMYFTDRWKNQE